MILGKNLFDYLNANQKVGNRTPPEYGAAGVTPAELNAIEKELGFLLPPDFRFLFQNVSDPDEVLFPWGNFDKKLYEQYIDRVWDGLKFDIQNNDIWLKRWGKQPGTLDEAFTVAKADFMEWPRLLPISGHRFLAAQPTLPDNPIFSVWQTDIIYYGANLAEYLVNEFIGGWQPVNPVRQIDVWSDFAEGREGI